ncbi:MAG: hypothetical protein P1U40_14095 [Coxiellaceae bacterium]|nr:hypothetical protein [Coxiellaceae bacterium]
MRNGELDRFMGQLDEAITKNGQLMEEIELTQKDIAYSREQFQTLYSGIRENLEQNDQLQILMLHYCLPMVMWWVLRK